MTTAPTSESPDSAARSIVRRLAGASAVNLAMQMLSTALGLVSGLVLSRLLGASGLGVYAFAFAVASVLSVVARLGLENLLVREVAVAHEQGAWDTIRGMVRFSEGASMLTAVVVGGVALLAVGATSPPQTTSAVGWGMVLLLGMSCLQLRSGGLRGLDAVVAAQVPGMVVRPVVFVGLIIWLYVSQGAASPSQAMAAHAAAYLLAWALALMLWLRYRPPQIPHAPPRYELKRWMTAAAPLMVLGGLAIINLQADLIMLKWLASDASTGIYSVANQLARFTGLFLGVVNAVIGARLAALHAAGRREELQHVVTASAAGITGLTVPVGLLLIAVGPFALSLYGPEFAAGYAVLVVLVGAQMVGGLSGSVGNLLLMSGHERVVGWVSTATALLNVLLNALLIPRFDMMGAAIASATALVTWNLVLVFRVRTVLGLESTAFGWARARWLRTRPAV